MTIRISGSSGIDVDSIVKQLMTAKRVPLDNLNQSKQQVQWQRDSILELNSKIVDFKTNKLGKYGISAALNSQKAVLTGDTASVKAEATAMANGVKMEVTVEKLATKATIQTEGLNKDAMKSITSQSTLAQVLAANNGGSVDEYQIKINDLEQLEFDGNTSISSMLTKINSAASSNIKASFDESTGKLIIESKMYGKTSKVDDTGSIFTVFGKVDTSNSAIEGKDATVVINGQSMTKSSNTFVVNGVQLTLLAQTAAEASTTVSTEVNADNALATIKSLISDYNDLLDTFNTKVKEAKYRDFLPLTDAQKESMKEDEIKKWEEKAKSGLLRNDESLSFAIASMRSILSSQMGELSKMGITAGQYYENGKIYIDDEKLKQAIQNDPQKVMELFQGPNGKPEDGIIGKLKGVMDTVLDKFVQKAGTSKFTTSLNVTLKEDSAIGKQLKDYTTRISDLNSKMSAWENQYYKQFSAMEQAMNSYNAQSSSLANYFK
ncbi:flagellar filament capping protein FliD [Paenibacillus sp. D51F]